MRKYHCVINGYLDNIERQMEEQAGFVEKYLSEMEEGEAVILCRDENTVKNLKGYHAKKAVLLTAERYEPEIFLKEIANYMDSSELYLFGSDSSGGELCVRAAVRAGGSTVTAVHSLAWKEELTVRKMVYSNHMEAEFIMEKGPFCVALAKGAKCLKLSGGEISIKDVVPCESETCHILSGELVKETEEKGLEEAKVVIAAGRGIKKKENFALIEQLAADLGGEAGVSRPAAMNAWAPMNRLVGVSGAMLSPDICITAGVSGAAAFYAGIEKSKHIVAINIDENAPIMKMADAAIVDDWFAVLEELKAIRTDDARR